MLIAFNKPFGVLCQFTDAQARPTLADFGLPPGVYPSGRLDRDSEGLLLLTDDGRLQQQLADPRFKVVKRYLAQVEGTADDASLALLAAGPQLADGPTQPADVKRLAGPPDWLWPRDPPVRFRKTVPDAWIAISIREGRNRQIRRMTAAVGLPTLRLIRIAIGPHELGALAAGAWRSIDAMLAKGSHRSIHRKGRPRNLPLVK